ncbi:uncharacterized protein LOC117927154 isoform X2 [Vitis riparia]|uniref:uncharacterized protein LOC117927154 isoform X2 n=1 Tax=Vitis riparia TaxID=96939 RepID=UPI00155A9DE7|nr:uncharacterized protein LOC117927154 isoform X2 [Vitis riparia]
MKTRSSRERKPSKFKVSPFVHKLRKMVKHEASEQMILCGSPHPFFDRKTSIVSKYISELDDCEKLFIPMHDDCPGHWYLCVIDFKDFDIQILDSLRSKSRDEFRFKSVKKVGKMSSNSPLIGLLRFQPKIMGGTVECMSLDICRDSKMVIR